MPVSGPQASSETCWWSGSSTSPATTSDPASPSTSGGTRSGSGINHGRRTPTWPASTAASVMSTTASVSGSSGDPGVVDRVLWGSFSGLVPGPGASSCSRLTLRNGAGFRAPTPDDRCLERDEHAVASSGQCPAGNPGVDERRGRVLEDVDGVGAVPHPEGDPQVDVRPHLGAQRAGRSLAREHEVDPEGATERGEPDQALEEPGHLVDEGLELVDDDDEPREWLRPTGASPVGREVVRPHLGEQALATTELRPQRRQGAVDEVLVEVGEDAGDMGKRRQRSEGGSPLEVDEDEGEVVGRRTEGEREDERPQELGLAGTRRATDEDVRSVGHEVDDVGAVLPHADGGPGEAVGRRPPPRDVGRLR